MRFASIFGFTGLAAVGITAAIILPDSGASQGAPATPARYDMDVGTASGFGAGMTGGQRPGIGAMLRGAMGDDLRKELVLRLGSSRAATGAPHADHFMPSGAGLGASVPLVTPQIAPNDTAPVTWDRPQGRILLFWGCGAHAGPGQPVIINLANLAQGQAPAGLFTNSVPQQREVRFSNSRTYGDWPNRESRMAVASNASLLGAHRIAGNYSPDIQFSLTQDFMPAIAAQSAVQADQSATLSWQPVQGATGYYAWAFGAHQTGRGRDQSQDIIWWSSSNSQQFGGALWDWISPATVAGLIRQNIIMPTSQTSCTIPAEVRQASPDMLMSTLYAYGPQLDFAYPPRPAGRQTAWRPEWTARVRYRATTGLLVGGPEMAGNAQNQRNCQPRRRRGGGLLGSVVGGVLGGGNSGSNSGGNGC